jgi:FkbM family methyltransferase
MLAHLAARIANYLVSLLRNRTDLSLSREEFRYSRISFSQFGEDLAILRWIDEYFTKLPLTHVYVDAGCFHPIHCSNTLLLHKRGWRGINIDLSRDKIALFNRNRPNDLNVCAALSDKCERVFQLSYEGGLTDRISLEADTLSMCGDSPIAFHQAVTTTLDAILGETEWVRRIGYLNIDCEGHDLAVLRGISLSRYQPAIITIEACRDKEEIIRYLSDSSYDHKETFHRTLLFLRNQGPPHADAA